MKHPRRRCEDCGKRRVGAYWLVEASGNRFYGSPNLSDLARTSGPNPKYWSRYLGWLCSEHSTLDYLTATHSNRTDAG